MSASLVGTTPAPKAARRRRSRSSGVWLASALIVGAGIAAYSNSFVGKFVFDDDGAIRDNYSIRSLWPLGDVLTSGTFTTVVGRPLLSLSLALNYAWGGLDVRGYHAFNLTLHLLVALALFGVVRRTLLLPRSPERYARNATPIAFSIALVWALHPLQTESVTYVVQRVEALAGLFYILTLYCLVRSDDSSHPRVWQTGAVIACLLGMASKEVMVSAPLAALVYDRVFLSASFRDILRRRWGMYAGLFATWILLAALVIGAEGRANTAGFGYGMSAWDYAMTQFGAIVSYLRLCFYPSPLILDYGTSVARDPAKIIPNAAIVVLLFSATLIAIRFRPWIGFVGLCFFAILAPSSSFIPVTSQTMAIHRMYLPSACVAVLVVITVWELWWRVLRGSGQVRTNAELREWLIPTLTFAALAVALGYRTFLRNEDFRSVRGLWEDNIRKCPSNPRGYSAVALEFVYEWKDDEALRMCDRGLAIDPEFANLYYVRGIAHANRREYEQSFRDYTRSVELNPNFSFSQFHRGRIALQLGLLDEALVSFSHALELERRRPDYWVARGDLLQRLGRLPQAIEDYDRALRLDPAQPQALNSRGLCHKGLGRFPEAIRDYSQAILLQPSFADARNNRGVAYAESGQPEKAIEDFTAVISASPQFAAAYKNRALCLYDLRQFDRAWTDVRMFQKLGGEPNPEFLQRLTESSGESP